LEIGIFMESCLDSVSISLFIFRDYAKPRKAFEFGPKIGSIASLCVSYEEDVLIVASLSKGKLSSIHI
jgi:hypothetical protein